MAPLSPWSNMLGIVLTLIFALDILLAVLSARAEPGTVMRKVALVIFAIQLVLGVGGGALAVFWTLVFADH